MFNKQPITHAFSTNRFIEPLRFDKKKSQLPTNHLRIFRKIVLIIRQPNGINIPHSHPSYPPRASFRDPPSSTRAPPAHGSKHLSLLNYKII